MYQVSDFCPYKSKVVIFDFFPLTMGIILPFTPSETYHGHYRFPAKIKSRFFQNTSKASRSCSFQCHFPPRKKGQNLLEQEGGEKGGKALLGL